MTDYSTTMKERMSIKEQIEHATVLYPEDAESPNDTEQTKELRRLLRLISDSIHDYEIACVAGWYDDPEDTSALEDENTILKKLLRCFMVTIEKDFETNERRRLLSYTRRMLDGV